jgi:hypothetical protein
MVERNYNYEFLTLAPNGGEWSASRPGRFPPSEIVSGAHFIGGYGGLDMVTKSLSLSRIEPGCSALVSQTELSCHIKENSQIASHRFRKITTRLK